MKSYIAAIAAIAAVAVADDCGYVNIVSHCDEDIHFKNVPSVGDTEGATCFKAGATYTQQFTQLSNNAGWSMKLSPDPSFPDDNTQQYEYTWQGGDEPVWYDMSYVNGQPYAGQWNFTSSDVELCNPTDSAYRYSTDDAYGMQTSCPKSVSLTLHLCPENAGSALASASSSESAVAATATSVQASSASAPATIGASNAATTATSQAATSTSSQAAYTSASSSQTTLQTSASSYRAAHTGGYGNKVQVDAAGDVAVAAASPSTTQVVSVSSVPGGPVVTETQVEVVTQVQTMVVTARDAAPSAHAHKARHEHRHPHGGRA